MDGMGSTIIICAILALICVFAVRSFIRKLKHGCCGGGGDEPERIRPEDRDVSHYPYVYRIGIEGMSCKNCAVRIENAFHRQEGCYAKVSLKRKHAVVRMKRPGTEEELRHLIRRTGYEAVSFHQAEGSVR